MSGANGRELWPSRLYVYQATVRRIIDADTMECNIDMGFRMSLAATIRLSRIDAWETRGPERPKGEAATEFVRERVWPGDRVTIQTFKSGSFGRWLAELWYTDDESGVEVNLNDELVENGHACQWTR